MYSGRRECAYKRDGFCNMPFNYQCIDCRRMNRIQELMLERACKELARFDEAIDKNNSLNDSEWFQFLINCAWHSEDKANHEIQEESDE